MSRSNNRAAAPASGAHDLGPGYSARRAPVATSFRDKLAMPTEAVEAFYALPRPEDVVVVFPGQRAPRHGDYLYFRKPAKDRTTGYWCVKMRPAQGPKGKRWSTECGFDELERARQVYINYLAELRKVRLGQVDPDGRPVPEILLRFVKHMSGRHHHSLLITSGRLEAVMSGVGRLAPFVTDMLVGDVTRDFSPDYMAWAKAPTPAGGGYAHNTARASVIVMREALETVLSDTWNHYLVPFEIPKPEVTIIDVFTPDDIDHVPIAAETGWIWDRDANDWRTVIDPATGLKRRAQRRTDAVRAAAPYGRLFLLGVIFGSRLKVNLNLTWTDEGGPWLDLAKGICHRLGRKERETDKEKGDCRIPSEHLPTLRQWKSLDVLRGINHVVHTWDGHALREATYAAWYNLLEAAGAQPLKVHCLKHTCVTIMRVSGVPLESAAAYLSTRADTLTRTYGKQWDFRVQGPAVEALGSLADFRKWHASEQAIRASLAAAEAELAAVNDNEAAA
jgi:integrase